MTPHDDATVRRTVRERYGEIAREGESGCGCAPAGGCCGPAISSETVSGALGYGAEELESVPEASNLGLGCGNPQALAALRPGETVLDLGSGGGLDCFLAARAVGSDGRVIGVDMTPDMIELARKNAREGAHENVEFRLGEIEHLPVADATVDVVLSNCVVNLSPDKPAVFRDVFRVLKPGGRVAISDVVALKELPADIQESLEAMSACVAGAATVADVETMLRDAGFVDVEVRVDPRSRDFIETWLPGRSLEDHVASAAIEAVKPASEGGDS